MKKYLFITALFLSTNLLASLSQDYRTVMLEYQNINPSKAIELMQFIHQIENPEPTEQLFHQKLDTTKVDKLKQELQAELYGDYLSSLINKLGPCTQSPCVQNINSFKKLSLEQNSNICFPNTDCGFYTCMEEKYRCMDEGYEYFEQLAHPTCSNYVKRINQNKFSGMGVDWIYRVMVCLQKGLVNECDRDGNCPSDNAKNSCHYMTEFTLSFHPGCYINSGIGICQLPIRDQLSIWRTVEPFLTPRERKEAYQVMWHCLTKGGKKI